MSGSEPSTPSCSEPAIGWPPTKRGSSTCATTGPFTPATSVTTPSAPARASAAASATAPAGVATKVTAALGSVPISIEHPELQGPGGTLGSMS